jgi:pectin methylesterase-like acyl-CoA thioesterase
LTARIAQATSATQIAGPAATTFFPSAGAAGVCPDTPLRLTFDAPVQAGQGKIKVLDASDNSVIQTLDVAVKAATQSIGGLGHFNYDPLIISGNNATIYLRNHSLAYNKTYYVTIDAGAFKTDTGPYPGIANAVAWRFTTRATPPAPGTTRLTVAADGSGDFCTVQGAIDFLPDGNTAPTTIFLCKGAYTELIYFSQKHSLTLTGEDRKQCVIEYANNAIFNPSSEKGYHRGVFLAAGCRDLVINNLTIRNTTPRGGSQAEALILNGDANSRAIVANVDLYSFQDTLQINGQAYVSKCYIEGDVDFMWGKGPCFFENCHCYATRSKAFYAQVRNPASHHGFVYHDCTFDGPPGVTGMVLNRIAPAAYPNCEVVLLDCVVGPAVSPVGWLLNAAKRGTTVPTTAPDLHFWEFNSHDAAGNAIDLSKRLGVSRELKLPQDAELIANYSKPSFVLGNNWEPQADPSFPTNPHP